MRYRSALTLAVAALISSATGATKPFNTYNFAGVKWLSTRNETKSALIAKGYKYKGLCKEVYSNCTKYEENDQIFSGSVLENQAEITGVYNHEGRLVRMYISIELNKGELINRYRGAVGILKQKYGKPYEEVETYDRPYSASSLFEALEIGKADVKTSWFTNDDPQGRYEGLTIKLSKDLIMWISYRSQFWDAEYKRRNSGGGNDL